MANKYIEGEKLLEISFDLPNIYEEKKLVKEILDNFIHARNIRIIKCTIYKESERLSKSRHTNGITVYNSKHIKQPWDKE